MIPLSSSTVTKPAHTETMSSTAVRYLYLSSVALGLTARTCWSSAILSSRLERVIQDKTLFVVSLEASWLLIFFIV
jgi:hypothetical protein